MIVIYEGSCKTLIQARMSKVFEANALKGKSLAAGMRKKLPELSKYGVTEKELIDIENDVDKAITMIKEVDSMREETSRRLNAANEQLLGVKERVDRYRKLIKDNYPIERWEEFGLMDKR